MPLHAVEGRSRDKLLAAVIEREVIPRLFWSLCADTAAQKAPPLDPSESPGAPAQGAASPSLVAAAAAAARCALSGPATALVEAMEALIARGLSLETIFLDVLAPAARLLGESWLDDRVSFAEVTIASSRLHETVRTLARRHGRPHGAAPERRRIHLTTMPGETHCLGIAMVEETFAAAGWETSISPGASADQILAIISRESVDILGLSFACSDLEGDLAPLVAACRAASRNPGLRVMVGGAAASQAADLIARIPGAILASHPVDALELANRLVPAAFQAAEI